MKLKVVLVSAAALFLVATFSTAYATDTLPTITTVCESKSGNLYAFNDGFSVKKKCDKNDRRIILIGQKGEQGEQGIQGIQGEKGDKGIQGLQGLQGEQGLPGEKGEQGVKGDTGTQGIQGEKGDKGEQGLMGLTGETGPVGPYPDAQEVIFMQGFLAINQQSSVIDTGSHKLIVISIDSSSGVDYQLYYSNDLSNWISEGSIYIPVNHGTVQKIYTVKGKYYKIITSGNTTADVKGILY